MSSERERRDHLRELWARYMDGETLAPAEAALLLAALEGADAAASDARSELLRDQTTDGWLRALGWGDDGQVASERYRQQWGHEADGGAFVRAVRASLPEPRRIPWPPRTMVVAVVGLAAAAGVALWAGVLHERRGSAPVAPVATAVIDPTLSTGDGATLPAAAGVGSGAGTPGGGQALRQPRSSDGRTRREVIKRFDFEDGRQPADWKARPVATCPPRPGNRFCLRTERFANDNTVGVRMSDRRQGLFHYEPSVTIAFDYWVGAWTGPDAPPVEIYISTPAASFEFLIRQVTAGQWVHAEVPLADFRPGRRHPSDVRLQPGDAIDFLLFSSNYRGQDVLFIDNVEIGRDVPASPQGGSP